MTRVGFLLLNEFTMIAFSSAIEVLRMANHISGKPLYSWSVISANGQQVASSNGLAPAQIGTYEEAGPFDMVFVCGGTNVTRFVDDKVLALLRRIAHDKVILGGLCTGTYALVKAGLLNGYRATIHWENLSALREAHDRIKFVEELFVIDRDRITCTGGIAPIDMMLTVVRERCGKTLVAEISEQFILERVRDSKDRQHIPLAARAGCNRKALVEVAALMEANIEEPLSLEELSQLAGLSQRHLQRLFREALQVTPSHYYLELRLRRARELLLQTQMSITNITVACGFQSSCHFSKCYRALFGKPPSSERRPQGTVAGVSKPVVHHLAA
ncbi:helix-turn-helix domain-containing protein [Aromatoleum petrolei]|uniref:Helix-turn-helix domain-containing protein n=1 Tax=Aromatoleum petrolei TaxID=76116 RepID=A0ABX1MKZ1_9RHOO|nr:helix-turn-helix domain-containing protein [Aromatoleum petrolei]